MGMNREEHEEDCIACPFEADMVYLRREVADASRLFNYRQSQVSIPGGV